MQDIRKPYTRSRSNSDLESRLERFHDGRYKDGDDEPVRIPVRGKNYTHSNEDIHIRRDRFINDVEERSLEGGRYNAHTQEERKPYVRKKRIISSGTIMSFMGACAIFGALGLYTFVFNSATITIVPKNKDVQGFSKVATFSQDGTTSIPFILEKTSQSKSKALSRSETKKVETKASGNVIVYNNYDENPQKLIRNTRFEASNGKIYRINEPIVIPGKKDGVAGSVEVTLYADSTGEEYNIATSDFTIPGFKGSPRYSLFYAKTTKGISGGSSGTKSTVSLSDINAAKDALALELKKTISTDMSKITKQGYTPMLSAAEIVYEDNEKLLLNGDEEVYKVTATGYVPFAESRSLASFVAGSFSDYDLSPVRLSNIEKLSFIRRDSDSFVHATSVPLLIEGDTKVVWVVDEETLKTSVIGRDTNDFKLIMKSLSAVESAGIRFSPRWISTFPSSISKISIVEKMTGR